MIDRIRKRWFFDSNEKTLLESYAKRHKENGGEKGFILIQAPADHYYLCLFGMIIKQIKSERTVTVAAIYPDVFTIRPQRKIFFVTSLIYYIDSLLIKRKWKKLYLSIGVDFFVKLDNRNIFQKFRCFYTALSSWRALKTKEEVLNYSIDGALCGDLIYDTYLRYEVKPTVDIRDRSLIYYFYMAHCISDSINGLISKILIDEYYSSYSTYIQHGIPVRLMLNKQIQVYTSGNLQQKIKKQSLQDVYHTAPHSSYLEIFDSLTDKAEKTQLGDLLLKEKFSGKIDQASSYMTRSVFNDSEAKDSFSDTYDGVVFLHDFFDSPHIYAGMLFADFYDWALHTLELIDKNNLNIAVKPHPNQIAESKEIINQLKAEFTSIQWIDPGVSNSIILKSNIKFGVSVYGTVLHELAYHGKIAICGGDNPHAAFDFVNYPVDIKEYDNMILSSSELSLPAGYQESVAAFYYMHNIHNKEALDFSFDELKNYNVFNSDSELILKTLLINKGD